MLDGDGRRWRIAELEHRLGTTNIKAISAIAFDPTKPKPASSGRNLEGPDLKTGRTELVVIDLPVFGTTDPGKPRLAVFAGGTERGWRRAALSVQTGDELMEIGPTALPTTIGKAQNTLPPHSPALIDLENQLEIQLLHNAMAMPEIEGSPLSIYAGLCWIENEFLRFGSVQALGNGRYRLTRLLRGCHGSENAIGGHATGDRFVLMDSDSARMIEEISFASGSVATVEALGLGDIEPAVASQLVTANATSPRSPVHLEACRLAGGSIRLSWVRRSRIDFGWNDGVDQAMVEDTEKYSISLFVSIRMLANG